MASITDNQQLFTREAYEQLKREQRKLHDMLVTFDKAEACGVDCQQLRLINEELLNNLTAIEQHFMTPPPR